MGNGISQIGDFVYLVAINLYVLDMTHSALAVAGIWMVPLIAQSLVGSWIGSVTDRLPKRPSLISVELLRAACIFALPIVPVVAIYPLLFVLGSASTFFGRLYFPYRTRLIPPYRRKSVNTWLSMFQSGALLLGPAVAGSMMQMGPVRYTLWVDALSFVVSALAIFLLPEMNESEYGKKEEKRNLKTWSSLRHDWLEAARFLNCNRLFLAMFIGTSVGAIFGQTADAQEVVYAEDALHLGQFGYGMMVVAAGIGYLSGAITIARWGKHVSNRWLIATGSVGVGVGYLVYALAFGFWQAVIGLILLGISGSAASVGYSTYAQHAMPVDRMGRINNLLGPPQQLITLMMMALGSVITNHYGVRILMISMTCIMIVTGLFNTSLALKQRNRSLLDSDATIPM
jgi:MFS family permease